jgi:NADH-quinone oxidoreductase subunit E
MLSDDERREIEAAIAECVNPRAATMAALNIIQAHRGWVSGEALRDVAAALGMTADEVDATASFYSLIFQHPVGRRVLKVCDSVVCWALGGESLMQYLERRLGIKRGETTCDGEFTLLPICCLGDCDHAPVMMVNERVVRNLTPEVLDKVLAGEIPEQA